MTDKRLVNRDLLWAPGTDEITDGQLNAMRARDRYAIRPIPSKTVLGHEHLMADADRAALLAEVDRLQGRLGAVKVVHRPMEGYSTYHRSTYLWCAECSDERGDGSRGVVEWPCDTVKAAEGVS